MFKVKICVYYLSWTRSSECVSSLGVKTELSILIIQIFKLIKSVKTLQKDFCKVLLNLAFLLLVPLFFINLSKDPLLKNYVATPPDTLLNSVLLFL